MAEQVDIMLSTKRVSFYFLVVIVYLLTWQVGFTDTVEFPGRDRYPDIPFIEIDNLNASFDSVVIVDVRSSFEFDTLHIKNAKNISLDSPDFVDRMKLLRYESDKPIVTYCYGKSCMMSYKAARKAKKNDISNIVVFDAGILEWTKKYSEKAVLLGQNPADPEKLISKTQLEEHMLNPIEFSEKVHAGTGIVLDLRDAEQRDDSRIFLGLERNIALSDVDALKKIIEESNTTNKPLYIYDHVGKRVRWLMYQLEANNANEYYFMKNGAKGYFKELQKSYLGKYK